MFTSSFPFAFFDYFRVPYTVDLASGAGLSDRLGVLRAAGAGPDAPALYWCRADGDRHVPRAREGRYRLAGSQIAGHLLPGTPDTALEELPGVGPWRQAEQIRDLDDRPVAAVWRDGRGSVFLPFDPGEVMTALWSERYTTMGRRRFGRALRGLLVKCYYAVRPLLPRSVQLRMRQGYAARQSHPDFPGWPEEHSLHDLYAWLFDLAAEVAGRPVPHLSPWPRGKQVAFVLTHDVETATGRDNIEALRGPERELGYRSSWNFVPERYDVPGLLLERLRSEDCEIGVHGLRHDGQDLASPRKLARRLPAMRAYAERWGAVGFRSPATQRSWAMMPTLGFDYDSSYTDSAPHEPQPGGCCTYLPFFIEQMVELPLTLPQDHTLFEILGHTDGRVWREKAAAIRDRGGMVLMIAHPDYVGCPGMLDAWRDLLAQFADDDAVWHALPREVSTWWRRRAATSVEWRDGAWRARGPAAPDAEVRFAGQAPAAAAIPHQPGAPAPENPDRPARTGGSSDAGQRLTG